MKKIFIAGCGYIGQRVARSFRDGGAQVTCLVRSPDHQAHLQEQGYQAVAGSLDDPAALPALDVAGSILYYFVPPPGGGIRDTRAHNFCSVLTAGLPPRRIIYVSATSVYSEIEGGRVTETSPALPASAMGKRRLNAEGAFREYAQRQGTELIILRVSGIYGPGRLPLMQIRQGQPLLREDLAGPSNRIHADDLTAVCLAAAERGSDGDIFNVSDGNPSSMTTYFNACADALGEPRQPQVDLEQARQAMSPLMFAYFSETRIVDNRRMLDRLGVRLTYPTLETGLQASLEQP